MAIVRTCDDERMSDLESAALSLARRLVALPPEIEGLTAQQSRIVHALRVAAPRIVPAELLAEAAALRAADAMSDGVLRAQICKLRRRRPDMPIETVRNVGYRWTGPTNAA